MSREEFEKMSFEDWLKLMGENLRGAPLEGREWKFDAETGRFYPADEED